MSKLSYFKLFLDDEKITSCLSDEEFGKLVREICDYIRTEEEPNLEGTLQMAFTLMKIKVDAQIETYNKKVVTNQKIGMEKMEREIPSGTKKSTSDEMVQAIKHKSIKAISSKAISNKATSEDPPPISPPEGADGFGEPLPEEAPAPKEPSVYEERFGRFWEAYPKKIGKGAARSSFIKLKPSEALTAKMLDAIAKAKQTAQWQKDRGQYIPNPATWLNQSRWEDNYEENAPVVRDYGTGSLEDWANV